MALSKSRKIIINNIEYEYKLSGGKSRYIGDTGFSITLTVIINNEKKQVVFKSKKWTEDMVEGLESHKNSFTPKDVSLVIKEFLNFSKISNNFELENWKVLNK